MNIDLLRQQQRWKDGLQELRAGFSSLESQVWFHCYLNVKWTTAQFRTAWPAQSTAVARVVPFPCGQGTGRVSGLLTSALAIYPDSPTWKPGFHPPFCIPPPHPGMPSCLIWKGHNADNLWTFHLTVLPWGHAGPAFPWRHPSASNGLSLAFTFTAPCAIVTWVVQVYLLCYAQ